ncbi:hypothetical protein BT63DRAFT_82552 [Microthyrium microscopicum]|uniref:DUF300-domain-containing protein n=1 Tax=Microthyrium microscopicum TaxID=703497 RepID=A0A6A6TY52_9PEZI|nr:hypothetical protein BT63DRAFT_82552 [Microthyrium microscopicum]
MSLHRILGDSSSNSSSSVCIPEPQSDFTAVAIAGTWTLHHIFTAISIIIAVITIIVSFGTGFLHCINFSNPAEQRQIVRIVNVPAIFAICAALSISVNHYQDSFYFTPLGDFYECFGLVAIWYYMLAVLSRHGSLEIPGGDRAAFSKRWFLVLQIIPERIITTIASWIIAGTFCRTDKKFTTAFTVINVINGISTAVCAISILRVYKQTKAQLTGNKFVSKLVVLKTAVILQFIQRIVFSILIKTNALKATSTMSAADAKIGIPNILISGEMFIYCFLFIGPYSWTPYTRKNAPSGVPYKKMSFARAVLTAWNLSDIVLGIFDVFKGRVGKGENQQQVRFPYSK